MFQQKYVLWKQNIQQRLVRFYHITDNVHASTVICFHCDTKGFLCVEYIHKYAVEYAQWV